MNNWKADDLVIIGKDNITDVGIIKGFHYIGSEQHADILLLYSKYSPVNTFVHAPKECVQIIGNIKCL